MCGIVLASPALMSPLWQLMEVYVACVTYKWNCTQPMLLYITSLTRKVQGGKTNRACLMDWVSVGDFFVKKVSMSFISFICAQISSILVTEGKCTLWASVHDGMRWWGDGVTMLLSGFRWVSWTGQEFCVLMKCNDWELRQAGWRMWQ